MDIAAWRSTDHGLQRVGHDLATKQQKQPHCFCFLAQRVKHLPIMQETQVQSLGREDPLEKGMATHSSILA